MESIGGNVGKIKQPKINYDDKKYDVFFSYMVPDINPKYLDNQGRIKLEAEVWGKTNFKSFSIQIADRGDDEKLGRKIYTTTFGHYFGYEFDINDRNFNVPFGGYGDVFFNCNNKRPSETSSARRFGG